MILCSANVDHLLLAPEEAAPVAVKKSKAPIPTLEDAPKPATKEVPSEKAAKKTNGNAKNAKSAVKELKTAKGTKTKETKEENLIDFSGDAAEDNEEVEGEDDDSEIDDQTEALLKGFESDGDDEDAGKEGGLDEGQEVPKVPDMSNRSKKIIQRAMDFKKDNKPGVVYVGRIPHGFYEHEMREYFKQFGTILKLRLSRNRKTGASKHVAWIQFESSTVAEIVAKTMDNYLLFNHILKVKVVPNEQIPPELFKGANKRFKKVPWNRIEGRRLAEPKSEDAWEKLGAREQEKRNRKAKKLKAIGYEFEAPEIKSAKGVAKKTAQPALADELEVKAIEAAPATEAEGLVKKEKKAAAPVSEAEGLKKKDKKDKKREAKAKAIEAAKAAPERTIDPVTEEKKQAKKEKKEKKRKVAEVDEATASSTTDAPAEAAEEGSEDNVKKPKKNKKVKADT